MTTQPAKTEAKARYLQDLAYSLETCIAANKRAKVDRAGRFILDGISYLARRRLALIRSVMGETGLDYPNLGLVKTHEAGVRDIVSQSAWHRTNSDLGIGITPGIEDVRGEMVG